MTVIKQLTDPLSHRRAERIPHQELHVESGEGPAKHRRPRAAEPYATTGPARSLARSRTLPLLAQQSGALVELRHALKGKQPTTSRRSVL